MYLRSNNEQKVKGLTRDVRGKPLINLDRRHKTSGADNRSCLVLLIASNFRIQCRILTRSLSVTMLCVRVQVAREQVCKCSGCSRDVLFDLVYPSIYSNEIETIIPINMEYSEYSIMNVVDRVMRLQRLHVNDLDRVSRRKGLHERWATRRVLLHTTR